MAEAVQFEFEKLVVYQEAREFRKRVYRLAKLLPRFEYKLAAQMRDAARSLTNCIAEGHGRYTFKDRTHFCRESRGSLCELVDDVYLCDDKKYAKHEHLEDLRMDASNLLRRMNGFIKYLTTEGQKQARQKKGLREVPQPQLPITNY